MNLPITEWPADGLETLGACPDCAAQQRSLLHDGLTDLAFGCAPGRWTLWRCTDCGSAYLDPRPDAAHIGLAYSAYYTHAGNALGGEARGLKPWARKALANAYVNARFGGSQTPALPFGAAVLQALPAQRLALDYRYRHIRRLPKAGGRLLDVGCGNGNFLRLAQAIGWQAEGVEPDPSAVAAARASGLDVRQGGIELLEGISAAYDQLTLSHVIEHVHDPLALLNACCRLLKPGGMLYLETPNIDANGHSRFGAAWRGLEVPRHLLLFSHRALHGMLARAGFDRSEDLRGVDPSPLLDAESEAMARRADPPIALGPAGVLVRGGLDRQNPQHREFHTVAAWRSR